MRAAPVLAIDIGSTGVRVARFDEIGRQLGDGIHRRHRADGEDPGRPNPERLLRVVKRALSSFDLSSIEVVSTSVLWQSVIAVDELGHPTSPMMTWEVALPHAVGEVTRSRLRSTWSHATSGAFIYPSYPLMNAWMFDSELVAKYVDLGSWLVGQLTGRRLGWSESIAAGSGLWDQDRRTWHTESMDALGIDIERIGQLWAEPIVAAADSFGSMVGQADWLPVAGDGLCHNIGQAAVGTDRIAVTAGTSGSVRALFESQRPIVDDAGLWTYRCADRLFAVGGAVSSVGNAVEWVQDFTGHQVDWPTLGSSDHALPDVYIDASVFGRRGPDYPWSAAGAAFGLTSSTTPRDLTNAFGVDIWRTFRDHHRAIRTCLTPNHEVVAAGGVLKGTPGATQMLANALGHPVSITTVKEPSLAGAGIIGAQFLHGRSMNMAHAARQAANGELGRAEIVTEVKPRETVTNALARRWRL